MRAAVLVAGGCLLAVACARCGGTSPAGTTTTAARGRFCTGSQLTGRFAVIPGSAGAGNIVYRLTLRNRSRTACSVGGLPVVRLLARNGTALPTHVTRAIRGGGGAAAIVRLAPGGSAQATARFSPDVPGVGEGGEGPCEPTAWRLRVTARGGGAATVPIAPPTPVCEHGGMSFSRYGRS